jgi:hypothetical protein
MEYRANTPLFLEAILLAYSCFFMVAGTVPVQFKAIVVWLPKRAGRRECAHLLSHIASRQSIHFQQHTRTR